MGFAVGRTSPIAGNQPFVAYRSGRNPELDLLRAEAQGVLSSEPGGLRPPVASHPAGQALGQPEAPAPRAGVPLPGGLPALELLGAHDLGLALGLRGSARGVHRARPAAPPEAP